MSRRTGTYGMLLDRGLTIEQMDLALAVVTADPDPSTNRRQLTMALRDVVSEQEASGKTKKCLSRVWLNPPSDATAFVGWARTHEEIQARAGLLHFGALLGTYPFVGLVCRIIGQSLQTDQQVAAAAVRAEVRRVVGDRSTVDVAARKVYTTISNLGLIEKSGQNISEAAELPACPHAMAGWLAHAVILTRQAESMPYSSVLRAPELLGMVLVESDIRAYPLLESHAAPSGDVLVRGSGSNGAETAVNPREPNDCNDSSSDPF